MEMIEHDEAYKLVIKSAFGTGFENISLSDSLNRILAEDVSSDIDMPPFNKSTVDGFACRKADLGSELKIIETIAAGRLPELKINEKECSRIMTGAAVPLGADMVFMVEDSLILPDKRVKFTSSFHKENIAYRGEDIKTGDCVLKSGKLIRPQDIAVMASVGHVSVAVSRMPTVAVISSGDELVEPSDKPGLAQIRNTNGYQLMAQISRTNASGKYYGIARDDKDLTYDIVSKAIAEADIVLITGGVSMGDFDFVPEILEKAGVDILFSRVNVQPGKPTTFGIHRDAMVFGLPGNPVSSFVQFELLVKPLIARMMNYNWEPLTINLPMKESFTRKYAEKQMWMPVIITEEMEVLPVEYHGSAHILSLANADGLITLPVGKNSILKGELVGVRQV